MMLIAILIVVTYAIVAIILCAIRSSIRDREAFEMAISRQIKAHYEFNKRHAKWIR